MDTGIKQKLMDIVGKKNFTDALIDMVSYTYDASDHDHRPLGAVWPGSTEQVSKILQLADRFRFPVTPRGAGTGFAGGAVPVKGGIVLDLCRMNRILDIRIPDRLVVVQPGVVYADLQKALAPYDFFFPPDPASGSVCTIGGNTATNAGGIRGAKYGVTRDYVLGLTVVLPDGRIMNTGSTCMKTSSGYDLTRLFVGSEGTLGVICEIILKVNPKPKGVKTGLAVFASLKEAGQAVSDIMHSGVIPSVLEILDENTVSVLREKGGMKLPDANALILVETDGFTENDAVEQMSTIVALFEKNNAMRVQTADSSGEADELWRARRVAGSTASQLGSQNMSEDVTVPISKVPQLLEGISEIVNTYQLPFVVFGHAGDGNLHPKIMYNHEDPEQVRRVREAFTEIFELTCRLGGTLTGEHGVGLAKAPYIPLEHDAVAIDVMKGLKHFFDPHNILNPGKLGLSAEKLE